MATLAEKLKRARKRNNLSMGEVARKSWQPEFKHDKRAWITQGYISRLEAGTETNPSYLKLKTLCAIYNIKPGSLF